METATRWFRRVADQATKNISQHGNMFLGQQLGAEKFTNIQRGEHNAAQNSGQEVFLLKYCY